MNNKWFSKLRKQFRPNEVLAGLLFFIGALGVVACVGASAADWPPITPEEWR